MHGWGLLADMQKKATENLSILCRGLSRHCPQCGQGSLFVSWIELRENCPICGLKLASREGDTWAFMYISTAFITGLFVLLMLFVLPSNLWFGRLWIALAALLFFLATWPFRKGFAIAFDYWMELRWGNEDGKLKYLPK